MSTAIFLPNWIGDVVMATPTLRALRKLVGPDERIVGVMRPYVAEVLAGTPWLDAQLFYDPRSKNADIHSRSLVRKLRAEKLHTAVLLTNSLRTGVLARLSGAKRRVGYARSFRSPLLTDKLAPQVSGRTWYGAPRYTPGPVLDYYLELAYALGASPESAQLELAVSPTERAAAERTWQTLGLPGDRPTIVFNSGGAFGAAKLWPNEYFAELARRLVARTDASILMICGPSERDTARDVVAQANHPRVVSLADDRLASQPLSIGLSKACVERASLMVTTDSGPRHFAAAFNVPVVSLFGPTHIEWSENHQPEALHLQKKLPCGPCQQRTCPLGTHQCMRELSVDEVERATLKMLSRYGAEIARRRSA
jgi:heptosyltransferase-2